MNLDTSTIAAAAPIEVDLAPIAAGQIIKVFWRGKSVVPAPPHSDRD